MMTTQNDGLFICGRKTYHADEGTCGYIYEEIEPYVPDVTLQQQLDDALDLNKTLVGKLKALHQSHSELLKSASKLMSKLKHINDEQAITHYSEYMDLRQAIANAEKVKP